MKRVGTICILAACLDLGLVAGDFWLTKPYTDWEEKEAAKLLQNSPWAREASVSTPGAPQPMANSRGRGRGNNGALNDVAAGGADSSNDAPASRGRGNSGSTEPLVSISNMMLVVRWQSALPVREALVVTKFGHEKADSEAAKKFIAQELSDYVIGIIGLPGSFARVPPDRLNEIARTGVSLRIGKKDALAPESVKAAPRDKLTDVYFLFPKTSPITLDDKEVEFVLNAGGLDVKRKFRLKDMVVGDKLQL